MTLAVVLAALTSKSATNKAEHYLAWFLLLAIGADCLGAGLFHALAPHTAAAFINWWVSPFQFEIGVADIAIGVVAVVSFWRSLDFKTAVALIVLLWLAWRRHAGAAYVPA